MSKLLGIVLFVTLLSRLEALELKVLDPCSGKVLIHHNVVENFENIGQLSSEVLSVNTLDFEGSELGVNTMYGTPVGEEALEIISRREMRSYGWCYAVDGVIAEVYPSDYQINSTLKSIEWFFGYAFYDSGVWKSQCERLYLDPKPFICQK